MQELKRQKGQAELAEREEKLLFMPAAQEFGVAIFSIFFGDFEGCFPAWSFFLMVFGFRVQAFRVVGLGDGNISGPQSQGFA